MRKLALAAVLVALLAAGCSRKPSYELDAESDAALRRQSAACAEAARAADAARFAACFTDDAKLVAPGLIAGLGPENIREELGRWMGREGFRLAILQEHLAGVQGREGTAVAQETGRYELTGPDGSFKHTYNIKWQRPPGGQWRADLLLLDVPEPTPPIP
jgi:ketosteroid isomerase-like protein